MTLSAMGAADDTSLIRTRQKSDTGRGMLNKDDLPISTDDDEGLVFAVLLDGRGGGKILDWAGVRSWKPEDGGLWLHFNGEAEGTERWLSDEARLPESSVRILLEEETRPRATMTREGLLAILRGINLNVGEDPYDMIALRMWMTESRLVTVRCQPMKTPREILNEYLTKAAGPETIPHLTVFLTERLTERMNAVVVELDEKLDTIEETLEDSETASVRSALNEVRYAAVGLRRYIGPQREALARIVAERPSWMDREIESHFREAGDKLQRYIEDLDAAKDRAHVIRDEISNRLADAMNQRMYALSMITGIFLPLGLITGLLGINVGGMPGVENNAAFWIICACLVAILAVELYIFRRLKWI